MPTTSTTKATKLPVTWVQFTNTSKGVKFTEEKNISMFALHFDANTFSVVPRTITLNTNTGEKIESLLTKIYLDENGNLSSGCIYFIQPDTFSFSNSYDVVINSIHEISTPVVAEVSLS